MLTRAQAKEKVEIKINKPAPHRSENLKFVVMDDATMEKEWGWVFFYQSDQYLKTGNYGDRLAGNAPYLVNKFSGELVETGTAYPLEHYIEEYEQQLNDSG